MHHKNILFVANSTRCISIMHDLKQALDVSILSATPTTLTQAFESGHNFDLIFIDLLDLPSKTYQTIDAYLLDHASTSLLVVQDREQLKKIKLPKHAPFDFVVAEASVDEFELRAALLLWSQEEETKNDEISIDNMDINLATYQVLIDGAPVDLTLMEYSLLSFLAAHPGRAYSREKLLHQVWGFEYCGGTRTVDVHIRRVRSKVGPQIASHIATVRGVGYLFKV